IQRQLHEDADDYSFSNIENILVRLVRARNSLLFLSVTMQVEQVNVIKRLHEALTHTAESWAVEIAVAGDEREYALAGLLDAPLRPAEKLHVIVLQPLRIPFTERLPVAEVVIADEFGDPFASVRAMAGVRRIAQHDEDGLVLLDLVGRIGLVAQRAQWAELLGGVFQVLQRVREKDVQALVGLRFVAPLLAEEQLFIHRCQREAEFEMRDGIRGHEQFKPKQARQQMLVDVAAPLARVLLGLELRADELEHGVKKCGRAGGRIENEHTVRLILDLTLSFLARGGNLQV